LQEVATVATNINVAKPMDLILLVMIFIF